MAAKTIKGLTIEIGGDTTKLGKALEDVNKKSVALSGELRDINKLLKLDPGNTDALAQKQKVLAEAVANSKEKLDILRKAEAQVQKQFERGEVSEEQVRALQREIISTTAALKKHEQQAAAVAQDLEKLGDGAGEAADGTEEAGKEAKKAGKQLNDLADSADKAGDAGEGLGSKLGKAAKVGLGAITAAAGAALGAMIGAAEGSREYRTEMGKLDTAFTTSGHSSEAAKTTYEALQGILGETDQAVEASNHLAKLAKNEEDLATWTNIATGVYATFGDSLPVENITEAANETAKTGQIVGGLADALNWAGVSEDEFQAKLDACTNEQERQSLITETLNGLYSEAAQKYRETNAEVIRANEANEAWAASMAEVGGAVEPMLTDIKLLGASLLQDFLPGITQVTTAFRGMLSGEGGASEALGEALSGIVTQLLTKVTELAPTIIETGFSLVTTLLTSIISMLPQVLTTGISIITTMMEGLGVAIPQLVLAVVAVIPQLVDALILGLPQLLQGAITLLMALVQAVPVVIDALLPEVPRLVTTIVTGLLDMLPLLAEAALTLFFALVEAVPKICVSLVKALPQIWTAIWGVLKSLPGRMWELLTLVVGKWTEFGSKIRAKASEAASNALSAVVNKLQNLPTSVWNAIKGAVSKVGTWGSNLKAKGRQAAKDLVTAVTSGVKSLPDKLKSIGTDLVKGLWNGINDTVGWIKGKIKGWSDSVLDGIRNFLGVHSPSTKTAWMGTMLSRGLAEGIEETADEPLKAMDALADDMFSRESDLNGLTLERNLNHTFSAEKAAGAADSGLMSKLDRILEAIERGQIITLDSNALVGATAGKYDDKLGQRRALAARGAL